MDFRNEILYILFLLPLCVHYNYNFCLLLLLLTITNTSENHGMLVCIHALNKLDEKYPEKDFIAPWEVTRWLVLSSLLFSLPSFYGYYNGIYALSTLVIFASIVSVNHWRFALQNSWRRHLDLIVAKITCFILFIHNIIYIRTISHKIFVYVLLIPALYCFYTSNIIYKPNTTQWRNYHFMFHILCICKGFLYMYNIIKYS